MVAWKRRKTRLEARLRQENNKTGLEKLLSCREGYYPEAIPISLTSRRAEETPNGHVTDRDH